MLTVFQLDRSVFVEDDGRPIWAHVYPTKRQATRASDRLCQEIAAGHSKETISIAEGIKQMVCRRVGRMDVLFEAGASS